MKRNLTRRFFAGLIDYTIVTTFFWIVVLYFGTRNDNGEYIVNGWPALLPFIFWFISIICTEQFFGATIGNGMVGLKPIQQTLNGKISFTQSFQRHLLDPIDMFPLGLIGILLIANSKQKQRLGDIWAKTIVVRDL